MAPHPSPSRTQCALTALSHKGPHPFISPPATDPLSILPQKPASSHCNGPSSHPTKSPWSQQHHSITTARTSLTHHLYCSYCMHYHTGMERHSSMLGFSPMVLGRYFLAYIQVLKVTPFCWFCVTIPVTSLYAHVHWPCPSLTCRVANNSLFPIISF